MDRGAQAVEAVEPGDIPTGGGVGQNPREGAPAQGGATLALGTALVRTIRHLWPAFNSWLQDLHDSRFQPYVVYHKRFLTWWGIALFLFKLGSRRQLDFDLGEEGSQVLCNLNRLAGTRQESLPVHNTLEHFLGHVGPEACADLRTRLIRRLMRMRVFDHDRVEGCFVVALDGTSVLGFKRKHCDQCLTQNLGDRTFYFHPVLEAKLVTGNGLALSMESEFIENRDREGLPHAEDYRHIKQDCELNAFARLAPQMRRDFPQARLLATSDSLFACGTAIQMCKDNDLRYIFTFKQGRTPAMWEEFQALLKMCPEKVLRLELPDRTRQVYRWVNDLSYQDSEGREHTFHALQCEETVGQKTTTFAWITDLRVTAHNVVLLATKGGRAKSKIENQGFNLQKNSGLNLEHAYSLNARNWKAFYYLLQIAHIILQLLEKGSLVQNLARRLGKRTAVGLFGSLKNIARRLLECVRYFRIPDDAYDVAWAKRIQIRFRFDSS